MLERVKLLKDLVVLNGDAHHVHGEDLKWSQSLLAVHKAVPKGLLLWLDFSATPKDQDGIYYPWTVCDYPLAQAVEDRIVKAPLIVTKEDDSKHQVDIAAVIGPGAGASCQHYEQDRLPREAAELVCRTISDGEGVRRETLFRTGYGFRHRNDPLPSLKT